MSQGLGIDVSYCSKELQQHEDKGALSEPDRLERQTCVLNVIHVQALPCWSRKVSIIVVFQDVSRGQYLDGLGKWPDNKLSLSTVST